MNRQQQIEDAAATFRDIVCCGFYDPIADMQTEAYIEGIEWADKNPNTNTVYTKQDLLKMGFAFGLNGNIRTPDEVYKTAIKYEDYRKNKFIEKVCEWLNKNITNYKSDMMGYIEYSQINDIIQDLRKAMEE